MKIYLDLDGVFANLDAFMKDIMPDFEPGNPTQEIWKYLAVEWRPFYRFPLIHDSLRIITMLQHHDLEFLTALPESRPGQYGLSTAEQDKRDWVAENISKKIPVNTVVGGKNKVLWLKDNPGAILIDDMERNINLWNEHGGIGIHHINTDNTLIKLDKLGLL